MTEKAGEEGGGRRRKAGVLSDDLYHELCDKPLLHIADRSISWCSFAIARSPCHGQGEN